jgi:pyruvate-formate lyase-activating enzyme
MKEHTFYITDYCPHRCSYCSSDASSKGKQFLPLDYVIGMLVSHEFDIVNISGGEPLSHPDFYAILEACKKHAKEVWVHTNAIPGIMHNPHVRPDVRIHMNLTVLDNVERIRILKRIKQGRELNKPLATFSHNWDGVRNGDCGHGVTMPDGIEYKTPCAKHKRATKERGNENDEREQGTTPA